MKKCMTIETLVRGVCVKRGQLLVCQSKGAANTYLPGGHVEFGERAEESLVREIREELGVKSRVGGFLGAVEHAFRQKGAAHCEINLVFALEIPDLDPRRVPLACEDWLGFCWIPLDRLGRHHLEPAPLRKLVPSWMTAKRGAVRWGSTI
jgi:8-oxo-dGTP diphosphatase